jgi:hypothetical protein
MTVSIIAEARALRTEAPDRNPEYDRALVELSCRVLGLSCADDGYTVARIIGVDPSYWAPR